MALVVEDGSVVTDANCYVSLADCNEYHFSMGNLNWFAVDEDKEAAMLRAMAWLESQTWKGRKTAYDNPLSWPRADIVDRDGYTVPEDEVPSPVVKALCEAALIELDTPGALRPSMKRGGQLISQSIEGVGSWTYASGAPTETKFQAVSSYLKGLVSGGAIIKVELA